MFDKAVNIPLMISDDIHSYCKYSERKYPVNQTICSPIKKQQIYLLIDTSAHLA